MSDLDFAKLFDALRPYAWFAGAVVVGVAVGLLVHIAVWHPVKRFARRTKTIVDEILERHWLRPSRYLFAIGAVYLLLPAVSGKLPTAAFTVLSKTVSALLAVAVVYALIKLVYVAEDTILHHFDVNVKDNLRARQVYTQVKIMRRLAITGIILIGVGVVALNFESFRNLGTGLLASAGVAGIVIGLAAQKTLGNLLAGIQIAITQPIRLDDVVIVEGEWGRIEEITLTYVVVRIWDLRRLILPISYFIEKPFQNWTRVSADILGTVFVYVDYTVPVEAIREEFTRMLQQSSNWDKKVNVVQVTDAKERTVEVRALMSAADASLAWDLRCEVREKLLAFLKDKYPQSLPRARVELTRGDSEAQGDSSALSGSPVAGHR